MNKKVLIIGGTSAIAQEVAKIYALEKAEIYLVGRNTEHLSIIAQDLRVRGAQETYTHAMDLNQTSEHPTMIQSAFEKMGKVDVALIAHGILGSQEIADHSPEHVVEIINTNFVSYASLLTCISTSMKAQKHGSIAVISSVAGDRGKQSNFVYGAAQAGKSTFTDGLRNRLFPYGIHVLTLKLGFVDTPMTANFKKGLLWAQPKSVAQNIASAIDKKKNIVYIPFFWRWIMLIITSIPEFLFKKLKL